MGLDVLSYVLEELGEPYYAPPRVLKEFVSPAGSFRRPVGILRVPGRTLKGCAW
jgi:hypothetical protein